MKKIFMLWKRARRKISCDVVPFFIALVVINISIDLHLFIGSESIETDTLTNNRKYFKDNLKTTKAIK